MVSINCHGSIMVATLCGDCAGKFKNVPTLAKYVCGIVNNGKFGVFFLFWLGKWRMYNIDPCIFFLFAELFATVILSFFWRRVW